MGLKMESSEFKSKNQKTILASPSAETFMMAKEIVSSGGVVAFPTETVYGLGASLYDIDAINRIFEVKGRPNDNPLIVHIHDKSQISMLVKEISESAQKLIDAFMPGPITIIFKKSDVVPYEVTAGLDTVAIRIPNNKVANEFLKACQVPIPAPSANTSSRPSPTTANHVFEDLNGKIPLIIDGGNCEVGIESTVVDATKEIPIVLRPGVITREEIVKVIGQAIECFAVAEGEKALSPGMKYKHYAPLCGMLMVENNVVENLITLYDEKVRNGGKPVILCFEQTKLSLGDREIAVIGKTEKEALVNFYRLLRELEKDYDYIISEAPQKNGLGGSLYNRMKKSCSHNII